MLKYKKNENLYFGEEFDEYIKNYDINKHNINTNTKVFMLIAKKANQELKKMFDSYIEMAFDERFYNVSYEELEHIKKNAELNVQIKWSIYMDHHEQYKLINMIKKKYGFPPQEKYIINYIKSDNETKLDDDEFSLEEIRKRTTFDNYAIYFNKCDE